MRYFFSLSYWGEKYAGSQIQPHCRTVEGELNKAIGVLFPGTKVVLSSRTDAGVHARENVCHFTTDSPVHDPNQFIHAMNGLTCNHISVRSLRLVHPQAHARFHAVARTYRYRLYQKKDPFLFKRAYFYPHPLPIDALNTLSKLLIGKSNFSAFCKKHTQLHSFDCTIDQAYWEDDSSGQTVFTVRANRFLRGMVRGLVASQLRVLRGKWSITQWENLLNLRILAQADFSVPGHGLYLEKICFPATVFLPNPWKNE